MMVVLVLSPFVIYWAQNNSPQIWNLERLDAVIVEKEEKFTDAFPSYELGIYTGSDGVLWISNSNNEFDAEIIESLKLWIQVHTEEDRVMLDQKIYHIDR